MSPERPNPDRKIDELTARLGRVEQRLAALEGALGTRRAPDETVRRVEPEDETPGLAALAPKGEILSRVGRTLVALAGAFLLRAITESGTIPQNLGTLLGIGYALAWLGFAARAARAGRRTSATFHGLASALIAFPLIFEATGRFGFLSPGQGATILSAVTAIGLGVASWLSLRRLAWVVTAGAAFTALALAVATKMLALFFAFLLALGFASLWVGYQRGWLGPAWLVAALADGSILLMALMVFKADSEQVERVIQPGSVVILQLALVLIYVGSLGARAVTRGETVSAAETSQGVLAMIFGLGGAVAVTLRGDVSSWPLGAVSLMLAVGCYAASFAFIDRQRRTRHNFVFFTTMALAATLVGCVTMFGGRSLALALAGVAVVATWLGAMRSRATLSLHGAVYAVAAGLASGLLATAVAALSPSTLPGLDALSLPAGLALVAAAICCGFPVARHGRTWGRFSAAPKLIVLAVTAIGLGGLAVIGLGALLPHGDDPAVVAVIRTSVLAASAIGLALLGKSRRFTEATWLVYPVLIVGGAKLLIEDVARGRASTLFVSLALYGIALILAPRIVRKG